MDRDIIKQSLEILRITRQRYLKPMLSTRVAWEGDGKIDHRPQTGLTLL